MPQTQTLIEALQKPACYTHAVEAVTLIETHISWILLTGAYAYKVKKPVDFGFLDFSTLEKRRFYCHEELRLNRRLAPDVYLDVVTITGSAEQPSVTDTPAATEQVLDYAVKMRQFDPEAQLDLLLSRQQLEIAHLDELADAIAAFHGQIDRAAADSPYGDAENIHQPVAENFAQIRNMLGPKAEPERLDTLESWSQQQHGALRPIFKQRKHDGFVRECHGDMHLGNIALVDERVCIFDCIEFNPNLRWIDVMSEVAFLVMDLRDRNHPGFAWRVLNRYLQITGDYEGLQVLNYYMVYRAMVRAKVNAIRAQQAGIEPAAQEAAYQDYLNYIALAETLTQPPKPVLILMHGFSGSGKTFFSQGLLENLGAIRLRSDVERKRLFAQPAETHIPQGVDQGLYVPDETKKTYRRLLELSSLLLHAGYSVIVDASFLRQWQRQLFFGFATTHNVPIFILSTQASLAALRTRLIQRQHAGKDASDADLKVLEHQLGYAEAFTDLENTRLRVIDTERPFDYQGICNSLKTPPPSEKLKINK